MKKNLIFILLLSLAFTSYSQKEVTLNINHMLGYAPFTFTTEATNDIGQQFKITRVDYYISGIKLVHDGGTITPITDKVILVKGDNNVAVNLGSFSITDLEGISFSIGVDTPDNNSDPSTKSTDDPLYFQSPSMHWGWSAGYRFVALEGMAGTTTLNKDFQLHGLWNANYFEQTITTSGVSTASSIDINLDADYTQALKGIDVASGPIDHGVNTADLVMLENFRDHVFRVAVPTAIQPNIDLAKMVKVYPIPANDVLNIDLLNNNVQSVKIIDINGKLMKTITLNQRNAINLASFARGTYILRFLDENNAVLGNQNIVTN